MSSVSLAFGVSGLFGPDQTSPYSIGVGGQTPESLPIPILTASSRHHRQDNLEGQQGAPSERHVLHAVGPLPLLGQTGQAF